MQRRPKRPQDFEAFYHRYVGLGEGCGCAERIIDVHEIERLAAERRAKGHSPSLLSKLYHRLSRLRFGRQ